MKFSHHFYPDEFRGLKSKSFVKKVLKRNERREAKKAIKEQEIDGVELQVPAFYDDLELLAKAGVDLDRPYPTIYVSTGTVHDPFPLDFLPDHPIDCNCPMCQFMFLDFDLDAA